MQSDHVAIVTGASRGIGRTLAVGFAKDGYRVAAIARTKAELLSIAKDAGVDESRIFPLAVDVRDSDAIASAAQEIVKKYGRVDVLVNNAGLGSAGTLDVEVDYFKEMLTVNLVGPYRFLQEIVPVMEKAGNGLIVNVASRAGKLGMAKTGAYGATKFGLVGLNESLYRVLCPKGIKVTALCPSWVATDMARLANSPLAPEEMIQTEDLMKTIRWLLSLSPHACVKEVMIECGKDIR